MVFLGFFKKTRKNLTEKLKTSPVRRLERPDLLPEHLDPLPKHLDPLSEHLDPLAEHLDPLQEPKKPIVFLGFF